MTLSYSSTLQSFLNPDTAAKDARPLFIWFAFISVGMGGAIFSKGYCFGSNGGVLISQLRRLSLQAMLRQVSQPIFYAQLTFRFDNRKLVGLI